ncbi:glycoside hydrolase family 78 protein [Flavobacterium saccharophilum]|uniref:Fibronectin type-III domain-containing protein n=1 Tax=Flavobacterium saccharophilum TaxID=29534 RepID=A0A1M7AE70_9FLAO|nr:hypothetical protein [Flavobacterium saccharophilum]SHL40987.1 hypothetical protein SAMN05444366_0637 [Flavobacterium saccharophilum]
MKNFIYLLIFGFSLISCGGGDDPVTEEKNVAPSVPSLVGPVDNKLCTNNVVEFQWGISADENKDAVTYQIQVAKDNAFAQIVNTVDEIAANNTSFTLEKNTAYYWRVKATDSKKASSDYSATFKFYTAGNAFVNHLPFAPNLVQPVINTTVAGITATLKWTATDVDTADILNYDVYFGTANPPTTKIMENNSSVSVDVTLEPVKEYFWRVVVKDNKGGEAVGQVWTFKTL